MFNDTKFVKAATQSITCEAFEEVPEALALQMQSFVDSDDNKHVTSLTVSVLYNRSNGKFYVAQARNANRSSSSSSSSSTEDVVR